MIEGAEYAVEELLATQATANMHSRWSKLLLLEEQRLAGRLTSQAHAGRLGAVSGSASIATGRTAQPWMTASASEAHRRRQHRQRSPGQTCLT